MAERQVLATISELRRDIRELLGQLSDHNVLVLRYGRPVAVLLDHGSYERLVDHIEDLEDRLSVYESREEPKDMRVPWEKVQAEAGLVK